MSSQPPPPPSPNSSRPPAAELKAKGANRTTKVAQKLKVLPDQPDPATQSQIKAEPPVEQRESAGSGDADEDQSDDEDGEDRDAEDDVEVYTQIAQIPAGTARRDALRLTKKKAKSLPRVTAYSTASSYELQDLMKFFSARKASYHTNARLIDDVIYTPYRYDEDALPSKPQNDPPSGPPTGDLLNLEVPATSQRKVSKFSKQDADADIFLFGYGVVVMWGMTEAQEKRFLSSIKRFEVEKLDPDDVEMEDLNFYYANYSRIYNDVITLRRGSSYMTKLSLSHALAQSVKISVFESLIHATIERTKDLPDTISTTGKIRVPHSEIMQQIGELFVLRMDINSVGSVVDSPEVFWSFPDLQPLYEAARSYLEMPQRINLLNSRVEVLQDMLQLLKESVTSRHSEWLEQIVIALLVVEIVLGVVIILIDLFAEAK
ncbi:DUF155-domain-containing protein [Sistotremastrum niveocremeum HHB9708]|uniref:DUF155-domain-containing protein n=1 Tax=Sistotremastrum niveocremeum HHB9708 TaxID=1314777 RepID=A0A164YQV7_9AGAM|nr:DUF155-domain-containing protein [Sistotremastrum niveocremeum HHB9708]